MKATQAMKATPARILAYKAISETRRRGAYTKEIFKSLDEKYACNLDDKERGFARVLALGVISTIGVLTEVIDRNLNSPDDIDDDIRDALQIPTYELVFLKKPAHVAINQGVELVKHIAFSAAGLANSVLRKISIDIQDFPWGDIEVDDVALARFYGFPLWLTEKFILDLGRQEAIEFMQISNEVAPIFLIPNLLNYTEDELFAELKAVGAKPICMDSDIAAMRLKNSKKARVTPSLETGKSLVADISVSTIVKSFTDCLYRQNQVWNNKGKLSSTRILEIGSGRATKTILIAGYMQQFNGAQPKIYAIEKHQFKVEIARKRLELFGVKHATVFAGDAKNLDSIDKLPDSFDAIFIDAPCSGTGTLRRHPEIRWKLDYSEIGNMVELSLSMLKSVSHRCRDGGILMFSTCSALYEENESVIENFLLTPEGSAFKQILFDDKPYIKTKLKSQSSDAHFASALIKSGRA